MAWLTHVAARPDGDLLAVTSSEGWLGLWLPTENRIVASHELGAFVNKLGWTPDGAYLLVTVEDDLVVLSADGSERVVTIATGHDGLSTFAPDPTKPIVVTTGRDGRVRLWELPSGKPLGEVLQSRAQASLGGTALALSHDAIVVGYANGYYGTCDPDGGNPGGGQLFAGGVASLALVQPPTRTDGASFIAGGSRGKLAQLLITPDVLEVEQTWNDPPKPISANTIEFAPDGRFVVACSDNTALLYSGTNDRAPTLLGQPFWLGEQREEWRQDFIVSAACFVPKTKLIATSHFSGCVKLWRSDKSHRTPVEVTFDNEQVRWNRVADPIEAWPTLD